ncbi:hypothetical protein [Burkholderia sp. Bp8963]|nr:hypothetical protein [Burkholderia sp. Bp8963]
MAEQAFGVTQTGCDMMRIMKRTMGEMSVASAQASAIIAVIESIAF